MVFRMYYAYIYGYGEDLYMGVSILSFTRDLAKYISKTFY